MARETQFIEIDLRGGIQTDESPLAIGPTLREAVNAIWASAGSDDDQRKRILSMAPHRDLRLQLASIGAAGPILAVLTLDLESDFTSGGLFVVIDDATSLVKVHTIVGDVNATIAETLTEAASRVRSGWATVWTGIEKSTVFIGHQAFGTVWKHEAPGDAPEVVVPYKPANNPFGADSLTEDVDLNPTSVSEIAISGDETGIPDGGTYKVQLIGVTSVGKETTKSEESAGQSVAKDTEVLAFTVPTLPVDIASVNVYIKEGSGEFMLQKTGLQPGPYHINGNGESDPSSAPVASFKLQTSASTPYLNVALPVDSALNFAAISVINKSGTEVKLANSKYSCRLATPAYQSEDSGQLECAGGIQVLTFTTPATIPAGLRLYVKKGTSSTGKYRLQSDAPPVGYPLVASTTYHINGSGGMTPQHIGFIGIPYSKTGGSPGTAIANVVDGTVHLDRLFLVQVQDNRRSLVWFTDTLDPDTIRPTNFFAVKGQATCAFKTGIGSLDASVASHLCVGTTTGVAVLDGDPSSGNAALRDLPCTVGIADKSCVTETSYGAVFLGTDGQFYLVPTGAAQVIPMGHWALAEHYGATFTTGRASLAWASPYLVYCPNGREIYLIDMRGTAFQQPPKWWGPMLPGIDNEDDPLLDANWKTDHLARVVSVVPESGSDRRSRCWFVTLNTEGGTATLDQIELGEPGTLDDRVVTLKTGFLHTTGHLTELRRVVLIVAKPEVAAVDPDHPQFRPPPLITVMATCMDGSTVSRSARPDGVATPSPDLLTKVIFDFMSKPVISDAVKLTITFTEEEQPDLHKVYAEVRVQPRQD